ncbi:hypothetical protein EYF80_061017 [Liparis tanakae]|uniref:Uncharacterized protein n=1 Tax=Liparis tanakae TaxID=230148 RepID=A0A4Z2EIZ6_9TELE|nr:hypothetical protein EYF80_061017 [Liparis tanakae]
MQVQIYDAETEEEEEEEEEEEDVFREIFHLRTEVEVAVVWGRGRGEQLATEAGCDIGLLGRGGRMEVVRRVKIKSPLIKATRGEREQNLNQPRIQRVCHRV